MKEDKRVEKRQKARKSGKRREIKAAARVGRKITAGAILRKISPKMAEIWQKNQVVEMES